MYLGKIMELGKTEQIFRHPKHPYTQALLSAIPHPEPNRNVERTILTGASPTRATHPRVVDSIRGARSRRHGARRKSRR